jgi:FixJ family two-component response regulator
VSEKPQIFVVDDDPAIRNLLVSIFERGGYEVVCFAEGESLLKAISLRTPHCILLDVHLPGKTGLNLLGELNDQGRAIPIFIISGKGDVPTAVEAIRNGALDFIEKPFRASDLLERVREGIAGEKKRLGSGKNTRGPDFHFSGKEPLTYRERDVLAQLIAGASNKEAGRTLGISSRTVEVHRARIMEKLGARNIADLIRIALNDNQA